MASKPTVLLCCLFTQKVPLERQSGLVFFFFFFFFLRRNSLLASAVAGARGLCVLRPPGAMWAAGSLEGESLDLGKGL